MPHTMGYIMNGLSNELVVAQCLEPSIARQITDWPPTYLSLKYQLRLIVCIIINIGIFINSQNTTQNFY